MVNHSFGHSPFSIVYTKALNHVTDLVELPHSKGKGKTAEELAKSFVKLHAEVTNNLEAANAKYKAEADKHRRRKVFEEGELVMVHLCRNRFPTGTYHKL